MLKNALNCKMIYILLDMITLCLPKTQPAPQIMKKENLLGENPLNYKGDPKRI